MIYPLGMSLSYVIYTLVSVVYFSGTMYMIYPPGMSLSCVIYTLVFVYFRYNVHDLPARSVSILCVSYTLVFAVYFRYNVHDLPTRNVSILRVSYRSHRPSALAAQTNKLLRGEYWTYSLSDPSLAGRFLLQKVRISYPNMAILFGSLFSVFIY